LAWDAQDALPFPVCVSSITDAEHDEVALEDVSVARGNIVAADHGASVRDEPLGVVPGATLVLAAPHSADRCQASPRVPIPPRFRPSPAQPPLPQAAPLDPALSAAAAMRWAPDQARPAITLRSVLHADSVAWTPLRDLLDVRPTDPYFVVEVERDGRTL